MFEEMPQALIDGKKVTERTNPVRESHANGKRAQRGTKALVLTMPGPSRSRNRRRRKIPAKMAAAVEFRSNLMCCICHQPGHQLHHLDSDPSNNVAENLVLLCFQHHDEASRVGGLSRKLTPETIRLFRDEWYRAVELGRSAPAQGSVTAMSITGDEMLEALAIHEVRKICHAIRDSDNWQTIGNECNRLSPYALMRSSSISMEVLNVLHWATTRTRTGMTPEVASIVSSVCLEATPTWSLRGKMGRAIEPHELQVLELAVDVGFGLAYDGAKYLRSLKVVNQGAMVLWSLLRFAHLNELSDLAKRVREAFSMSISGARDRGDDAFEDAVRWLEFKRADSLALDGEPLPSMPWDLQAQLR